MEKLKNEIIVNIPSFGIENFKSDKDLQICSKLYSRCQKILNDNNDDENNKGKFIDIFSKSSNIDRNILIFYICYITIIYYFEYIVPDQNQVIHGKFCHQIFYDYFQFWKCKEGSTSNNIKTFRNFLTKIFRGFVIKTDRAIIDWLDESILYKDISTLIKIVENASVFLLASEIVNNPNYVIYMKKDMILLKKYIQNIRKH